jgi:hypothetical protein
MYVVQGVGVLTSTCVCLPGFGEFSCSMAVQYTLAQHTVYDTHTSKLGGWAAKPPSQNLQTEYRVVPLETTPANGELCIGCRAVGVSWAFTIGWACVAFALPDVGCCGRLLP